VTCSWRCCWLWSDLLDAGFDFSKSRKPYINGEAREKLWKHFGLWFLDVFFLPFGLIVLVTIYRVPRMIRKVQKKKEKKRKI
jgi:hypothetical protein